MLSEEDIIRLKFEAQGIDTVDKAKAELAQLDARVQQLAADLKAGTITAQQFDQSFHPLAGRMADLHRGFGLASGGVKNIGYAAMEASRAVEDLQYGLGGVVNNIPSLVMALGGGAGLTAAISLAAVGANQLYRHWDDLMGVMGFGTVGTEAEQMERLEKATGRTADETERLNRYKKEQQQVGRLSGAEPKAQAEARKTAEEAITEAGGIDRLAAGLVATRNAGGLEGRMSGELRQRLEKIRSGLDLYRRTGAGPHIQAALAGKSVEQYLNDEIKSVMEQARKDEFEIAREDIAAAANDPKRLKGLIAEIGRKPGAFPEGAAAKLTEATPEAIAHDEAVDADLDRFEQHIGEMQKRGQANARTRQKNRQKLEKLLGPALDRALQFVAGGGEITADVGAAELANLGIEPGKAGRFGGRAADVLNDMVREVVSRKQAEEGVGPGEALAAIQREAQEKAEREAESTPEARKARREEQESLRAHQAGIREDMRDVGGLAKASFHDQILARMLMGEGDESITEGLAAEINAFRVNRQGAAPDENYARGIAGQVVDSARAELDEKLGRAIDRQNGVLDRLETALNAGMRKGAKINLSR